MPMPEPNDPELYWAAGFIEGEGSFCFSKGDGSVRIDAAQKEREPLERLQRVLGGGIYWGGPSTQVYRWRALGKAAEKIDLMQLLYPLMSSRRQDQIDAVLAKLAAYPGSRKQREMNAKRAQKMRERYRSDPEYRAQRRASHDAWAKRTDYERKRRVRKKSP